MKNCPAFKELSLCCTIAFLISDLQVKGQGHRLRDQMCQIKVSKGAKIRNRYNQVPHLTQLYVMYIIWASMRENLSLLHVNNKDAGSTSLRFHSV